MNCNYTDIRCSDVSCDLCEKIQKQAYNKAIDDAIKIVKENYRMETLERLEQLKVGESE